MYVTLMFEFLRKMIQSLQPEVYKYKLAIYHNHFDQNQTNI